MQIRRHLLLLAFSLLIPAVIACGAAIALTYSYERQRADENLLRTTQVLAESLDRRLNTIIMRLEALATSPSLPRGDLPAFWRQARQAVTDQGMWIVLMDRDAQQMVNTLREFGAPLPRHGPSHSFTAVHNRVFTTGRPLVSDMFIGPVSGKPTLAVTVPVRNESGAVIYTLSMGIDPSALADAVSSLGLPKNWLAAAFDANMAAVARSREIDAYMGKPPVPALAEAMRNSDAGQLDVISREGIPTRTAFSRTPAFGWRFAVGVPSAELAASVTRTLATFAALAAALLAVGAVLAIVISRRISGAIGMLVPAAAGLRDGAPPVHRATGVTEVDKVSLALEKTGHELHLSETQRRQAEDSLVAAKERAEDILSSIADGFYALDGQWRFTYINARAQQILGRTPAEILGREFLDVFPQVRDTQVYKTYARVMADRRAEQFNFISPILQRWTSFSAYPAGDGGIAVYFRDISEWKAAEADLIAAKDEAERANRAKSHFLASASHDLRQPVQALFFFHEILADMLRGQPAGAVVTRAQSALDALKHLLDGLLDISRLHAGTVELERTDFPVALLLEHMEAENADRAAAQGVALRVVGSSAWVRSDKAQLERILRNLVDNALKYTPSGGAVVVGCRRGQDSLRLQVADSGLGIPDEQQDAIFEEFVQLANPERDRAKGLGLGLAIVRHLGRLLDHPVKLRSRFGHGTVFSVTVPLAPVKHPAATRPARPSAHRRGGLALVVDDESLILTGMRAILESWGWEVLAAESGEGAVRLVADAHRPPDVIIADYRLRDGETGVTVIRDVNGVCGTTIPAVVLTGDTSPERIAECARSGFQLLHKPVDATVLQDALTQVRAS